MIGQTERQLAWLLICALYSGLASILVGKVIAHAGGPKALIVAIFVWILLMALFSVVLAVWLLVLWLAG